MVPNCLIESLKELDTTPSNIFFLLENVVRIQNSPVREMPQKGYDFPRFLKPWLLSADFLETPQSVCKRTKAL